jgi:hypothetical protein
MKSTRSATSAALLAFAILALGFIAGLGYQSWQHAQQKGEGNGVANTAPRAPAVRNLRLSPDDRLLVFTAIYSDAAQAGRFVFDLQSYRWNEKKSPSGWQDSIAQWNDDGRSILFEREKIPRTVESTSPGLYQEKIGMQKNELQRGEPEHLAGESQNGEKVTAGFQTGNGQLVLKTRRESKALYLHRDDGSDTLLDRSPGTYYQNRAVQENGKTVYYVVRDVSLAEHTVGLFRLADGKARPIGSTLSGVVWAYLADDAKQMIVCRYATDNRDWEWSLFRVTPSALQLLRKGIVPQDVVAVYWSPDYKRVLGAAGKSLWIIELPDLRVRQLGTRDDWNADDAAWFKNENAVVVAAGGHLWKVNAGDGTRREIWKFPNEYWK